MARSIDRDLKRFRQIVRSKVRKNLRKYLNHGEIIGRRGREIISIPVPNIEIPNFRHGQRGSGGVGQGEGEIGQPVGKGQDEGEVRGEAGNQSGGHIREVEVTLDELAEMLGEELELPRITPKGTDAIRSKKDRYTTVRHTGPDSLRHFTRTYNPALKRQIASDAYDPDRPVIVPTREDEQYRSWKSVPELQANAAIIYIMDLSGSMTDDQKEIVRIESFWIDTWLHKQYDGIQRRYIVHDAVGHEVDEDTFYRTRESGGTRISSAYRECTRIIRRNFPPDDWNIYCFQFSEGDNWGEDNNESLDVLRDNILSVCNLFCYGQVESPYGSGDFIRELRRIREDQEHMILSEIPDKDASFDSIREFLGTGR